MRTLVARIERALERGGSVTFVNGDALLYPFFLDGIALNAAYNLDDGIHPNKQGVAIIVDKIYPDVKKLIGQ